MSDWIVYEVENCDGEPPIAWQCGECGEVVETKWNYCPVCGDPKTGKGKNLQTLIRALEVEHKKLREMQKAQPEIIRCKDCKHNPKFEWFGCPMSHMSEKQRPETAWCWKAERRTDE